MLIITCHEMRVIVVQYEISSRCYDEIHKKNNIAVVTLLTRRTVSHDERIDLSAEHVRAMLLRYN